MRLQLDVIKGRRDPVDADREAGLDRLRVRRPAAGGRGRDGDDQPDGLARSREYGFTPTDAYCLVSTCPDFRINVYQMCKMRALSYVAGAEIPKRYLSGQPA